MNGLQTGGQISNSLDCLLSCTMCRVDMPINRSPCDPVIVILGEGSQFGRCVYGLREIDARTRVVGKMCVIRCRRCGLEEVVTGSRGLDGSS